MREWKSYNIEAISQLMKSFYLSQRLQINKLECLFVAKWLPGMNPLAYLTSSSVTKEKSFIKLTPDHPRDAGRGEKEGLPQDGDPVEGVVLKDGRYHQHTLFHPFFCHDTIIPCQLNLINTWLKILLTNVYLMINTLIVITS